MIELDEIMRDVLVHAPEAPEVLAIRFLREAAQELCERAKSWKLTDTLRVTTPECEAILVQQGAQIVRIDTAFLNERRLEPVTVAWLDENDQGWEFRYTTNDGQARYAVQKEPNTIGVIPRETGDLLVRLTLKPSRDATAVPDFIVDRYHRQLGAAAAARVLLIPNTEIANPQLGAALWAEWTAMLDALALDEQKSQLRTKPRTVPAYF